jgi:hypothetical protein
MRWLVPLLTLMLLPCHALEASMVFSPSTNSPMRWLVSLVPLLLLLTLPCIFILVSLFAPSPSNSCTILSSTPAQAIKQEHEFTHPTQVHLANVHTLTCTHARLRFTPSDSSIILSTVIFLSVLVEM